MTTTTTPEIYILLFKIPTATDLVKGLKVAYKGYDGEYMAHRIGTIIDIFEQDGILLYNVDEFAYAADELRLIS